MKDNERLDWTKVEADTTTRAAQPQDTVQCEVLYQPLIRTVRISSKLDFV